MFFFFIDGWFDECVDVFFNSCCEVVDVVFDCVFGFEIEFGVVGV